MKLTRKMILPRLLIAAFLAVTILFQFTRQQAAPSSVDWPFVGGDANGTRYSELNQINRKNVKELQPAWEFHTGGLREKFNSAIQCTPLVIDGVMYLQGIDLTTFALDPATGRELWRFNPQRTRELGLRSRGLAHWSDGKRNGERRIILAIPDGKLFSIDAKTGKLDPKFGQEGVVNLRTGIERDIEKTSPTGDSYVAFALPEKK